MFASTPPGSGGSPAHSIRSAHATLNANPNSNSKPNTTPTPSSTAVPAATPSANPTAHPTATPKRPRGRPRKGTPPATGVARPEEPSLLSDPAAALWSAMVSQFADPTACLPPARAGDEEATAGSRVHRASDTDVMHSRARRREAIVRALERCAAAPPAERRRWTPHAVAAMCSLTWASLERWAAKDEEIARLLRAVGPRASSLGVSEVDLAEVREMLDEGASIASIARRHGLTKKALIALAGPSLQRREPDRPKAPSLGEAADPATPTAPTTPTTPTPPTPPRRRKARKTPQFSAEGLLALREMKALEWGAAQQAALFATLGILELRRGCRDVSVLRRLDRPAEFNVVDLRREDPQLLAEAARSAYSGATLAGFCESIGRTPEALLAGCARFATVRLALARTPIGRCPPVDALLRAHRTLAAVTFDPPPQPPTGV